MARDSRRRKAAREKRMALALRPPRRGHSERLATDKRMQLPRGLRGCIGKVRFPTEVVAAKCLPAAQAKAQAELRAYPCALCSGWHYTSKGGE